MAICCFLLHACFAARVVCSKKIYRNCYAQPDNRQQFLIQLAKELVFDQVKRRAVAAKTMNLPYRINLETVLDSLSASCDQSGASSKRQAMSSSLKKTPTKSSTLSDSKFPASQKAKRKRSPSPPAATTPRKRCTLCPTKRDRKTKMECSKCSKYVCGEHSSFICTVCNSN
ncbi:PiggyBac transposable element-derived protein 4 [Plakobranchus ocellatus]|uniref:PiggyBac transposable element-derived protein 4 n=1 Tax=Plakobranchus ocellatus TaxID=259542 RepID=A0AAV3ZZH2_9GAST|nr:PiggyBac transposable element-derived protein 4 [Plakobranchus ocellatus]